jgi:hypothetical protein
MSATKKAKNPPTVKESFLESIARRLAEKSLNLAAGNPIASTLLTKGLPVISEGIGSLNEMVSPVERKNISLQEDPNRDIMSTTTLRGLDGKVYFFPEELDTLPPIAGVQTDQTREDVRRYMEQKMEQKALENTPSRPSPKEAERSKNTPEQAALDKLADDYSIPDAMVPIETPRGQGFDSDGKLKPSMAKPSMVDTGRKQPPKAEPVFDQSLVESLFETTHGTSFDPKSQMDRRKKMEIESLLEDMGGLGDMTPNQFALQLYRRSK